jgi:hypothetical protein
MSTQLHVDREAATAQNILTLINFLQDPEVRAARETVFTKLQDKDINSWTEKERSGAARVCSSYDVAAIIIKMGLVPTDTFDRTGVLASVNASR